MESLTEGYTEQIRGIIWASIKRPATFGLSAFAKATADERFSTRVHPP